VKSTAACWVLIVGVLAAGCGRDEDRDDLPVVLSYPKSLQAGFANPTGSPPGADDPRCEPSADHPRPVVLVHGTFNNRASTWNALAPLLKNEGYCVFSLNFGVKRRGSAIGATESMVRSARELAGFVDGVLDATGAEKVDIVGYSQGGLMPRQYLRFEGGAAKVASLIALAPSNHGTTGDLSALAARIAAAPGPLLSVRRAALQRFRRRLDEVCRACAQQLADSPFLARLNTPRETLPGVRYTVIASRYDQVVTPYTSQFLAAGPGVTNITLQDDCPRDHGDHLSMPFDSVALGHVTNALDPDDGSPPRCVRVLPGIGG
jgi:pimeloyl-ACP methyl ester carboxylesterase